MALIRCPKHQIPYNDENPRGCPACASEKEEGGQANIMKELARRSRTRAGEKAPEPASTPGPARTPTPRPAPGLPGPEQPPVTPLPALLETVEEPPGLVSEVLSGRRWMGVGAVAILVLAAILFFTTGPRFVRQPHPAEVEPVAVRPLPFGPGTPTNMVFAVLGNQGPSPHPDDPRLTRYGFGAGLQIDALNQVVYAITFSIPNRSWQGLRPGLPEQNARGALALLGTPEELPSGGQEQLASVGRYFVYPSLDERPVRRFRAEVRPPNGCLDVLVDLRPRAIGLLLDGDDRFAVIGRGESTLDWVVTQVRVVSRAIRGPYAAGVAC